MESIGSERDGAAAVPYDGTILRGSGKAELLDVSAVLRFWFRCPV